MLAGLGMRQQTPVVLNPAMEEAVWVIITIIVHLFLSSEAL